MVPLLIKDHAEHNVLQSEVYQRPCIWGWEEYYLEGDLLVLLKKWHSEKTRAAFHTLDAGQTPAERGRETLHSEKDELGRSLHAIKTLGNYFNNSEHQSNAGKKAAESLHEERDEKGKSINAVKGGIAARDNSLGWFSPETVEKRIKMSIKRHSIPVKMTNLLTGEIRTFPSTKKASIDLNVAATHITRVLKKKKKSVGGWTAEYLNPKEIEIETN